MRVYLDKVLIYECIGELTNDKVRAAGEEGLYVVYATGCTPCQWSFQLTTNEIVDEPDRELLDSPESADTPDAESIDLHVASEIRVFPNPSNEEITVESDGGELSEVKLFDLFGNLIISSIGNSAGVKIRLDGFSAGKYVIIAVSSSGRVERRLVVKK